MDDLMNGFLAKAGQFSDAESLLLEQEVQFRKIKKDELLLKKGEICSSLCFVVSGSFYQYNVDSELNKNVIDLNAEGDWVINHKSFTSRKPSERTIQAFEDSSVYELSVESIHNLIAQSQSFLQMGKILEASTSRIEFFDNNSTPDEKYQYLLNNEPILIQKFPQKIIASYLKITPETLSRVRKRIA